MSVVTPNRTHTTYTHTRSALYHVDNIVPTRKWQRRFLTILFTTIFVLRGRVNFTNMARYSTLHEQTFRRQFEKHPDWPAFNLT